MATDSNNNSTLETATTKSTYYNSLKSSAGYITNKYVNYRKFIFFVLYTFIFLFLLKYVYDKGYIDFISGNKELKIVFFIFLSTFFIGISYFLLILSEKDEIKRNGKIPPGYNPDNYIIISPYIKVTLYFLIGILAILSIMYGLAKGMKEYPDTVSVICGILLLVIFLVGIYLFYNVISKLFKKLFKINLSTSFRLLKNISLYSIFCFYTDIKNFIVDEYRKAPKEVWNILLIELVLIGLYFLVPYLRTIILFIICHDAKKLLNEPVYLDVQKEIATSKDIYNTDNIEDSDYIYNFSISFWYYVNPTANDDMYYNVITYNGKPLVEYNQHKNKLRVKMNEGRNKETEIYLDNNVETQKWNHVVINYQSNTMDIFINNEMVSTTGNLNMPYMSYDNIIVGKDNGIQGGICNVMYFKRIIPKRDISLIYYLCKNETPPIL